MRKVHAFYSAMIIDLRWNMIPVALCVKDNHRLDTGWERTKDDKKVTCKRCLKIMEMEKK